MADFVVGTGATVHHQNLLPLSGCVVVIGFQAVALHDNRLFGGTVDDELTVAPREDAAALVAIHLGSRLNSQGSIRVDECITIDDVGPFLGPYRGLQTVGYDMIRIRRASQGDDFIGNDVVGVLSPSQELDGLCVTIGDKLQFVFHYKGCVQVVRVDGDAHEGEEAVLGRDYFVV